MQNYCLLNVWFVGVFFFMKDGYLTLFLGQLVIEITA